MKRWYLAAQVLGLVAVCGGALASFGSRAPAQEIARESLDLLKTMRARSAAAQSYVATCITAIAAAQRQEVRKDASPEAIHATWTEAAGRCRAMAASVCDALGGEAPREACKRIRTFDPLM